VLYRGSRELEGFWSDFEVPRDLWTPRGPAERIFSAHLDFLRRGGISGGVVAGKQEGAALLAAYLAGLPSGDLPLEDGKVIILARRDYYESCLSRELSPAVAVGGAEGVSLFSPQFRGIGLGFYETMPGSLGALKPRCDILILAEPETVVTGPRSPVRDIAARIILGICADGEASGGVRALFGLRGAGADLEKYLLRNIQVPLPLPPPYRFERIIRRPPRPFSRGAEFTGDRLFIAGGGRFVIQSKFKNIGASEYAEEQGWFFAGGKKAPRPSAGFGDPFAAAFNALTPKERAFFCYWRNEFRKNPDSPPEPEGNLRASRSAAEPGDYPKTEAAYICLYARELILSLGNTEGGNNFRELLRLWRTYREDFSELDRLFPQWLLDFWVIYKLDAGLLGELFPYVNPDQPALLRDLCVHHRHIENDGPLSFSDAALILGRELQDNRFYQSVYGPLLEIRLETALTGLDSFFREQYQRGIFGFFYPSRTVPVLIEAFPLLRGMGRSSYTAEWIRFSGHRPLRAFLRDLTAHVEYRLRRQTAFPGGGRKSPLEPVWRDAADRALGFSPEGAREIRLEDRKLDQLRDESDAVRELLRIPEEGESGTPGASGETPFPSGRFAGPLRLPPPMAEELEEAAGGTRLSGEAPAGDGLIRFIEGLPGAEREALALIARGAPAGEFRDLALKHRTMPELLADAVNTSFLEAFNDILVETSEEGPVIGAEYEAAVKSYFGDTL
jgi:hypothetical protein